MATHIHILQEWRTHQETNFSAFHTHSRSVASESGQKWGINIEKIEGVGSGEGFCTPQLVSAGLPQKEKIALKIMQF